MKRIWIIAAPMLLAGCGSDDSGAEAGGMTPVEARALEDAAEMLDQQRLPDDLVSAPGAQPQPQQAAPVTKQ